MCWLGNFWENALSWSKPTPPSIIRFGGVARLSVPNYRLQQEADALINQVRKLEPWQECEKILRRARQLEVTVYNRRGFRTPIVVLSC
jgi:hypothetical protein